MIPHGVHYDIPEAEYRKDPAYSYSQVKRMLPTAKDYKHLRDNPKPPSLDMAIGTLINRMILEPERRPDEGFVLKPEPRAPNGWKDEQEKAGLIVTTASDVEDAKNAAAALREHSIAGPILTGSGHSEVTVIGELCGVRVKCRVDRVPDGVDYLPDLKKSRDCSPGRWEEGKNGSFWMQSPFARQARDLGYHIQAGAYLALWNQQGDARRRWLNVCVESDPPYHVRVFEMEPESIVLGINLFEKLLRQLLECEATNKWPGYPEEVEVIGVTRS
jgi:hypothetical protein